jgi:hypothetical protein
VYCQLPVEIRQKSGKFYMGIRGRGRASGSVGISSTLQCDSCLVERIQSKYNAMTHQKSKTPLDPAPVLPSVKTNSYFTT